MTVDPDDTVIFSADPAPPGTEQAVNFLVDNLIEKGVNVHYYDTQEDLHVSGHGSQKDIEMLFALIKPKYLIPIGGTIRHMRGYRELAQKMGWKKESVFELRPGESVDFTKEGQARKGEKLQVKSVLVDGLGVGDVGNVILRDRKTLAKEGVVVVIMQLDKSTGKFIVQPDVISRGFVFGKEQQVFLEKSSQELAKYAGEKMRKGGVIESKEIAIDFLERHFFEETGRRPMILPVVIEV